jgi:hypothetical protein
MEGVCMGEREGTSSRHPAGQGLYRREHEHDSCGIGFVANIRGQASRAILRRVFLNHAKFFFNNPDFFQGFRYQLPTFLAHIALSPFAAFPAACNPSQAFNEGPKALFAPVLRPCSVDLPILSAGNPIFLSGSRHPVHGHRHLMEPQNIVSSGSTLVIRGFFSAGLLLFPALNRAATLR